MGKGYLSLILHAHLPFIRHPEYDKFLEEDWFFEAVTETYIPLINVFDKLMEEIDFRITMSLSPTLISMFTDTLLQSRYIRYIEQMIQLAEREMERTKHEPWFNRLAKMYYERFRLARNIFAERYHCNLLVAFRKYQVMGRMEIMTCAATHGYLPVLKNNLNAVRAQIYVAIDHYQRHFGRKPLGLWLPECGYEPGIDRILKDAGIRYCIIETHGILFSNPRPRYGHYAPVYSPDGLAFFARDIESSKRVWSAAEGYPGDALYREFYRDIGFDLDYEYIRPYLHGDGKRGYTGIKYYRITGKTDCKEPYLPEMALSKASEHAGDSVSRWQRQINHLCTVMDRMPVIIAPYDAELFGHWWYEGPDWIDFLLRKIAGGQDTVSLITPAEYLNLYPVNQVAVPSLSSWGYGGFNEYWLNKNNDWIYRHLHKAAERMVELARTNAQTDGSLKKRALNQAARELLLAQGSDWAFIMKAGTSVEYAMKRVKEHLLRFNKLYEDICSDTIDAAWLDDVENKDNIFPEIDYHVYL